MGVQQKGMCEVPGGCEQPTLKHAKVNIVDIALVRDVIQKIIHNIGCVGKKT